MDTTSKTIVIDSESLKQSLARTKGYTDSALRGFEDRIKQVENDVLRIDEDIYAGSDTVMIPTMEDLANAVDVISEDEAKAMLIEVYGGEIFNSKLPVGGLIYYINPDVTGDYKFYREDGSEITGWSTVDDLVEAHSYEKLSDNADDKFYVIYDTIFSEYSKYKGYSNFYWVYEHEQDTGGAGYEQVLPYQDSWKIGKGRTNTQIVMAKDGGVYIAKDVTIEGFTGTTLWWVCKDANDSKLGGCNDWFIPSQFEGMELVKSSLCLEYFEEVHYFLTSTEDSYSPSYVPYNDIDEPSYKRYPSSACALVRAF